MSVTIELPEEIEAQLRAAAARRGQDAAAFVRAAVEDRLREESLRRSRDELAAEGYRALSSATADFAAAAAPMAAETWPEWEENPVPQRPKKRKGASNA